MTMKIFIAVIAIIIGLISGLIDEDLHAKYLIMERANFVEYFNAQNYTWKMKQYATNFSLCDMDFDYAEVNRTFNYDLPMEVSSPKAEHLPENFDSRERWLNCTSIREIYHQFNCASCWTYGVANTASDRTCIHLNIPVILSQRDLECIQPLRSICNTGDPFKGFQFWKEYGLVTSYCKPYSPDDLQRIGCRLTCTEFSNLHYQLDKYFAEVVYPVPSNSLEIKTELFVNGPIQAIIPIYPDFIDYKSGIYKHTFGEIKGWHSVRIIGYGVEDGTDYWLIANSWGVAWGENGFVRMKTFQEDIMLEERLITGLPKKRNLPK